MAFLTILVTTWAISTPKDHPYRVLDPDLRDCNTRIGENGNYTSPAWNVLTAYGNDENLAALEDKAGNWDTRFRCALQRHEIPDPGGDGGKQSSPLGYTLAFLEFKEEGEPFELKKRTLISCSP